MIRIKRGINFGRKIILNTCFFQKKSYFLIDGGNIYE